MDDYSYGRKANKAEDEEQGEYGYGRKPSRGEEDEYGDERKPNQVAGDDYGYESKPTRVAEDDSASYEDRPSKVAEDDSAYGDRPSKVAGDDSSYEDGTSQHQPASSSDLLSSAKYMTEAAQLAFNHETEKIDKSRMAGAAGDILEAASRYGKLEEGGLGQYVEKAQNYLDQYGGGQGNSSAPHSAGEGEVEAHSSRPSDSEYGREEEQSSGGGGGFGQYLKMAEGFLKK